MFNWIKSYISNFDDLSLQILYIYNNNINNIYVQTPFSKK